MRHLARHIGKVGSAKERVVYRVDALLGSILLALRSLLAQAQQYVRGCEESLVAYLLLSVFINQLGLGLYVVISDKRRTYLLVAIAAKLLLERRQRVHLGIERSLNLQLVVDKQVHILVNALLVDNAVGIVLVV